MNRALNKYDAILIGRGQDCAYRINSSKVSQRHATLTLQPNGDYLLQDLNSTNGTFLEKGGPRISGLHLKKNKLVYFADHGVTIADIIAQVEPKDAWQQTPSGQVVKVGRDPQNTISINDQSMSRFHAEMWRMADGAWQLKDCGSTNGTFVNGEKISTTNISVNTPVRFGTHDVTGASLIDQASRYLGSGVGSPPQQPQRAGGAGMMPPPQPQRAGGAGVMPPPPPLRPPAKSPLLYIIGGLVLVAAISLAGYYDLPAKLTSTVKGETTDELVERATVLIMTKTNTGSGFFISKNIIVTNQHVVVKNERTQALYESVYIINKTGTLGQPYVAKVIASTEKDSDNDYAVLRLDDDLGITPLQLNATIERTDEVNAWGYPGLIMQTDPKMQSLQVLIIADEQLGSNMLQDIEGQLAPEVIYSKGEVRSVTTARGKAPRISHTAEISGGNSGGPLVNAQGHVVGVNTFIISDDAKSANFALGTADLIKFLKEQDITFTQAD